MSDNIGSRQAVSKPAEYQGVAQRQPPGMMLMTADSGTVIDCSQVSLSPRDDGSADWVIATRGCPQFGHRVRISLLPCPSSCASLCPTTLAFLLFLEGVEWRLDPFSWAKWWESPHPTQFQPRLALLLAHPGHLGFLSLPSSSLPSLLCHCWIDSSCLPPPCQPSPSPFPSWPHFPWEYVMQRSHWQLQEGREEEP